MADIGSAYLTIFPSMDGFATKLQSELSGVNVSAIGDKMGDQLGDGISDGMGKATKSTSGFSSGLSALAGFAGGVAAELAGRLFDSVMNLSSEMIEASDSAQKFASTLSFAGIDDSTIQQLTASTQAYADATVYDLADIRNVTAQLASNGVDDYAQLAEAAGNLNAVAGGSADTFRSVSMVMSQTAGMGKLTTENWNQLAEAIPGASGALQEAMADAGAFEGNFREAMENGEVSAEEFFAAVQKLGMQDVAVEAATSTSTIEGALGNLEASVVGVGSQLITALNPAITGIITGISDAVSWLGQNLDVVAPYAAIAAAALGAVAAVNIGTKLASAVQGVGGLAGGFKALWRVISANPLVAAVAAFAAVAAALVGLYQTNETFRNAVDTLFAQISAAVMPVLQQLGTLFASIAAAIMPVVSTLVSMLIPAITSLATMVGQFIANVISAVMPVISQIIAAVQTAMPLIQAAITTALTVIQTVWNAVWPALQAVVMPIVQGISDFISGAMTAIQGVIDVVLGLISGDWSTVWTGIQQVAQGIWDGISGLVSGAIDAVQGFIDGGLSAIGSIWESAWTSVSDFLSSTWEGIKTGVSDGIDAVVSFVEGLPDTIIGIFSGAGDWLVDSGKALLQGFADGVMGAVGWVGDQVSGALSTIRSFFPFSPAKRGPFSGRGYTTYSGRALMTDFGDGIARAGASAASAALGAVSDVERAFSGTSAQLGAISSPMPVAPVEGRGVESADDALLRSIDDGIAYIAQLLPEALDPATRARFARGAVTYAY